MNITIYTKSNCPNCETAKNLLKSKSLAFKIIDAEADPIARRALLETYPSARQMPQVFIEGQRVGGLEGLQAALKQLGL